MIGFRTEQYVKNYVITEFIDIINDCLQRNLDGHDILIMIIDNNEAGYDDVGKDDKNNLDDADNVNLAWISLKF